MSYASAASRSLSHLAKPKDEREAKPSPPHESQTSDEVKRKRSPLPFHIPKTSSNEEQVYILTLLTNKAHHQRMTALRNKYFPAHINKLAAHMTLFHALPGSELETSIIPTIQAVAAESTRFSVHGSKPFKMKRGIAISVPKHEGGQQAQDIHGALQREWLKAGFLSEQDSSGMRLHYTIMNKVDDVAVVDRAFEEVQREFDGDRGIVEGLALYRYDRGWWRFERKFALHSPGPRKVEKD